MFEFLQSTVAIRRAADLDAVTRAAMWRLYAPHHNVEQVEFDEKLASIDEMALFASRRGGSLVGFCGLRFLALNLGSERIATFYMGLTFIDRAWRSHGLIQRMVVQRMLVPWVSPRFDRVYFWSDCLTYRPYLIMARNLREFYPSRERETPPHARAVIEALGRTYYGDNFDAGRGTVLKQLPRLKAHEREVTSEDLADPDIRFYMDLNGNYLRGDGLIAICPVTLDNFGHYLGRSAKKALQGGTTRVRASSSKPREA
jgi:hypothetical protein